MSYQVLARKYRPQSFADVIGQEHVTRTLRNALAQKRLAHGYIFSGHRGIGKTTVARILAMAANCRSSAEPLAEPCGTCESCTEVRNGNSVDVIEIDAATNRDIDEIRELREAARYRPARDRYKIYILDEAHQITDAAFNALLKTLEEPPPHVIFMLATTAPEDIPQTIRSRCQHFSFHAVRFDHIVGQLRDITRKEKIEADEQALALLAEAGDGSMRDALSILDQAIASAGPKLTGAAVLQLVGAVPGETLEQVMKAVSAGAGDEVLRLVDKLISEGQNPTHFARQMARFLRNTLVAKVAGDESPLLQLSPDESARAARVAALFSEEDLTRFLQIMLRTHGDVSYKQEQRFHLELGLMKLVHAERMLPLEELLSGAAGANPPSRQEIPQSRPAAAPISTSSPSRPSPFHQDVARKGREPQMSGGPEVRGSLAVAVAPISIAPAVEEMRAAVIEAIGASGSQILASTLEEGAWSFAEGELLVEVSVGASFLEMALKSDVSRAANSAASRAAGRPIKLRVKSVAEMPAAAAKAPASTSGPQAADPVKSARARAIEDPIVQRMQEKFGAEIRTVIDHREKKR